MKLSIKFRKIPGSAGTIDYINRRLSFALAGTRDAIQSTAITVSDINGPKGGMDKQCRVVIKPNGLPDIVVSEKQADLRVAIDRGIARASQSLSRRIKRKQLSARRQRTLKYTPIEMEEQ